MDVHRASTKKSEPNLSPLPVRLLIFVLHRYDVAFPTECDDEFWENDDPEKAFVQPADMPSKTAFWNCYIRLFKVIAYATRTIVRCTNVRDPTTI